MEILVLLFVLGALILVPLLILKACLSLLLGLVLLPFKILGGLFKLALGLVGAVFGVIAGLFGVALGGLGILVALVIGVGLFVLLPLAPLLLLGGVVWLALKAAAPAPARIVH